MRSVGELVAVEREEDRRTDWLADFLLFKLLGHVETRIDKSVSERDDVYTKVVGIAVVNVGAVGYGYGCGVGRRRQYALNNLRLRFLAEPVADADGGSAVDKFWIVAQACLRDTYVLVQVFVVELVLLLVLDFAKTVCAVEVEGKVELVIA